jgi:nucleotide-binding universal stress UspA family protein
MLYAVQTVPCRARNKERLAAEKERLRARLEAKRRAAAAAQGGAETSEAARVPGSWTPTQHGIPTEQ